MPECPQVGKTGIADNRQTNADRIREAQNNEKGLSLDRLSP